MMQFFRKYQRYFFIVLTAIIVVSFSFFGTYNSLASSEVEDQKVFKDVAGNDVRQSSLSAMIRFLATDADDKIAKGGAWGPNFLNDGVIKKDFLQSGLAWMLLEPFAEDLKQDIDIRKERQKNFKPYSHPYNKTISAQNAWSFFAPSIVSNLDLIKGEQTDQEFLKTQIALYLDQENFPSDYLKKIVYYQESESRNFPNDPYLQTKDLSLFGYQSLEDWFGPNFLQLSAQFIINSASFAHQRGIKVSDEEALAELLYNNEISFRALKEAKSPYLLVKNSSDYFKEQLRYLGMDQKTAVDIWKQVIAFRKLSQNVSDAVFVDGKVYEEYQKWAKETINADIYELPEYLKLEDEDSLKLFQTYMGLVLKESQDPLLLSKDFKSVEEIKSIAPELVQKRYDLNVAEVAASDIEMRATLKDVWNWQLDSANWPKLLVKFPELGKEYNLTREQRLARLEALLPANRLAVDQFTRKEILNEHSQWIIDALDSASFNKVSITIKEKGCSIKQLGLSKAKVLQTLLDNYPLNGSIEEEAQKFAKDSLYNYTEDGSKYFRIEVIGRENAYSPLTFKEALDDGSLKIISDKNKQDITLITDLVLQYADEKGYPWHESGGLTKQEFAAQYRFLKYANEVLNQVKASDFTSVQNQQDSDLKAAFLDSKNLSPFFDQFKMVKKDTSIARSDYVSYDMDIFYTVSKDQLSNVVMLPKSNAYFFKVNDFKKDVQGAILLMQKAQKEIGRQAAMLFLKSELDQMMTKKALSIYKMPQEGLDS